MKPKLILCLALILSAAWFGCSTVKHPDVAKSGYATTAAYRWGEAVGGFQMATLLDETNGIIHCWIRNATTEEMDYPSFDFGYFEYIRLEVLESTNWVGFWPCLFPISGASSACFYSLKRIKAGQIITDNWTKERNPYRPLPADIVREQTNALRLAFLQIAHGDTNQARLLEQAMNRQDSRGELLLKLCRDDTFSLDLIAPHGWPKILGHSNIEARVSQEFRVDRGSEKSLTLYSPVFILDSALVQPWGTQNRALLKRISLQP